MMNNISKLYRQHLEKKSIDLDHVYENLSPDEIEELLDMAINDTLTSFEKK